MKYQMFSVRDDIACEYGPIQFFKNIQAGSRWFVNMLQLEAKKQGFFPDDYTLYTMGTFDSETGEIIPMKPMVTPISYELPSDDEPVMAIPDPQLSLDLGDKK